MSWRAVADAARAVNQALNPRLVAAVGSAPASSHWSRMRREAVASATVDAAATLSVSAAEDGDVIVDVRRYHQRWSRSCRRCRTTGRASSSGTALEAPATSTSYLTRCQHRTLLAMLQTATGIHRHLVNHRTRLPEHMETQHVHVMNSIIYAIIPTT